MHVDSSDAITVEEYLPAAQNKHAVIELAALETEYFPDVQEIQADAASLEYDPGGQGMHKSPEFAPENDTYFPATHEMQTDCAATLYLPALHTEQSAAPDPGLYFPASQS